MCFRLKLSNLCVLTSLFHFLLAIKGERERKRREESERDKSGAI